ncbi:carboxylic ester hydrolase [Dictyobacter alpinus]|uniref:Carboxylic ester hydrolase n=1 Tax=Dictyobacter alpinus TaxID=2014873 RepID=A0A402BCX5_9CHLR|nr:carboxylic ester hydrolase [Dictyobacter alpinus]GCE29248.1 carboxylic ester hydrolase [Dictyobacter alpinus]
MRPVEILVIVADFLTFLVIAVPRLRTMRWMGGIALIAFSLAVVQMLVEGPRWQMIPAYVLAVIFLFVWLALVFVKLTRITNHIRIRRFVVRSAISLAIIGLALSAVLPNVLPVFQLPRPSGPYAIGTLTYDWTDVGRREVFSPDRNRRRELMVQIWYPAIQGSTTATAPYLSDADAVTTALTQLHHFPSALLDYLTYVKSHAGEAAPVVRNAPNYPVLIYLEGLTGYRQMSTFQVEALVSYGYIVVGIDQPGVASSVVFSDGHHIPLTSELFSQVETLYHQSLSPTEPAPQFYDQTFPNGIIPYFAQDVSFTLDQLTTLNTKDPNGILTGKLDLAHIGMLGISMGGMVGAEACLKDTRIKACLMMDVAMTADVVHAGLQQSTMWITRPADSMRLEREKDGGWSEQAIAQTLSTQHAVYASLPGDGYFVQVPGMFHIDFTDLDLLAPLLPIPGIVSGPIGSQRAHEIVNVYSLAFFDKYLKSKPEVLLAGASATYPEVIFAKRRL